MGSTRSFLSSATQTNLQESRGLMTQGQPVWHFRRCSGGYGRSDVSSARPRLRQIDEAKRTTLGWTLYFGHLEDAR